MASAVFPPLFVGATAGTAGIPGLTPAPAAGDQTKYLRADGTWQTNPSGDVTAAGNNAFTGINSFAGSEITPVNPMGALAIDVTKYLNTKTISTDSTFTFSGTPATAQTWFALLVTNSDSNAHTLTVPSSFSLSRNAAITTVSIAASGKVLFTWQYDGSAYNVYGDPVATTGSGSYVLATSPTLVTPNIGAATATSINGLTITSSTGTVTVTNGKTVSFAKTITFDGTDSTTHTFPSTSQTIAGLSATQTFTAKQTLMTAAHGTDNTWEGMGLTGLNAGATLAQWEAVYIGGSSTYLLADADGSGTYPAIGLAVAAYSNTNPAIVVTRGTVRNDAWNWTPGGNIYLSTTAGGLTQTAPSTTGNKVQVVGVALTADIMFVNPSADYGTAP